MRFVRPTAFGLGAVLLVAWIGAVVFTPAPEPSVFEGAETWIARSHGVEPVLGIETFEHATGFSIPEPRDLPLDLHVEAMVAYPRDGMVRLVLRALRGGPPLVVDVSEDPLPVPRNSEVFVFRGVEVSRLSIPGHPDTGHPDTGHLDTGHPLPFDLPGDPAPGEDTVARPLGGPSATFEAAWWEVCGLSFVAVTDAGDHLRPAQPQDLAPAFAGAC